VVFSFLGLCPGKFLGQIEIVPADDTVLDQAVAGLGDFLIFFFLIDSVRCFEKY
jgi:hypothetical protein